MNYKEYPKIDESNIDQIAQRRFVFRNKNGMLYQLMKNNQALIIVKKEQARALIKHFENRKIKTDLIKENFNKWFIIVSYNDISVLLSLIKLCEKHGITKQRKIKFMLFDDREFKYKQKPKTINSY